MNLQATYKIGKMGDFTSHKVLCYRMLRSCLSQLNHCQLFNKPMKLASFKNILLTGKARYTNLVFNEVKDYCKQFFSFSNNHIICMHYCYSAVLDFWPVEFSNGRLGASHWYNDSITFGEVLLSTSISTAGLVTLKFQANKHLPSPVHHTQ